MNTAFQSVASFSRRTLFPALAALILIPSLARADHYGICEGPDCGGGLINGLGGLALLLCFLALIGPKRAAVFLSVWLGPAGVAALFGEATFSILWLFFGFYLSFIISPKIIEALNLDKESSSQPRDRK